MLYASLIRKKLCPKLTMSTTAHFELEISRFEAVMKKQFKRMVKVWNQLLIRAFNVAAPFMGVAVGAKTKTP